MWVWAELESVPPKDWKWKASFQPLCTKLDCALVSRGVVCFFVEFLSAERSSEAGLGAAFCQALFMGIPPQMSPATSGALQLIWGYKAVPSLPNGISGWVRTGAGSPERKTATVRGESSNRGKICCEVWDKYKTGEREREREKYCQFEDAWAEWMRLSSRWEGVGINQRQPGS